MRSIKDILASPAVKELLSEIGVDCIGLPYVISTVALYGLTSKVIEDNIYNDNSTKNALYYAYLIALYGLMVCYAVTCFCTFSDTNAKLLDKEFSGTWSSIKYKARRWLGIPSTLYKQGVGVLSFYLSTNKFIPWPFSMIISVFSGILGFSSELAVLWSSHNTNNGWSQLNNSNEPTDIEADKDVKCYTKETALYSIIYVPGFFNALCNMMIYFLSTISAPKKLKIIDHNVGDLDSPLEVSMYCLIILLMLFTFMATYISFGHLNENMYGLNMDPNNKWYKTKNLVKKITGLPAAAIKIANASVSNYIFVDSIGNMPLNVSTTALAGISGLITQFSILYSDPLKRKPNTPNNMEVGNDNTDNGIHLETLPRPS